MNVFDPARNCYWQPAGLAWGGCYRNKCYFHYSIPDTFKLVAYLPSKEKVFMTNEVESRWFNARYAADLKQDGTGVIQEAMPFPPQSRETWSSFFFAMVSIFVQLFAGLAYFGSRFRRFIGWQGLGYIVLGNLLSLSSVLILIYLPALNTWLLSLVLLPALSILFISLLFYSKYREVFDKYQKAFVFGLWLNALSLLPALFVSLLIG